MFAQDYIQFSLKGGDFLAWVYPPKGKVSKPVVEAERAAFYYYKRYKSKKLILCLSGGLDSEAMAESFLRAGVPFEVSIWRYKGWLNDYDIKYAFEFCKRHSLEYNMEECDLDWFYGNNFHILYGRKYLCNSPQVALHMYMLEKLFKLSNVAVFLPWQPPSFAYDPKGGKAYVIVTYFRYLAYYRFFNLNEAPGSGYFIISRSALFYSFLKLPIVRQIMRDAKILKCDNYRIKSILYEQGGFKAKAKSGKFTGFDKFKVKLNERYKMDYNRSYRYPLMRMMPDPKKQTFHVVPVWAE